MSAKLLFYFLEKIMQGNCGKDVFAKWKNVILFFNNRRNEIKILYINCNMTSLFNLSNFSVCSMKYSVPLERLLW